MQRYQALAERARIIPGALGGICIVVMATQVRWDSCRLTGTAIAYGLLAKIFPHLAALSREAALFLSAAPPWVGEMGGRNFVA